MQISLGNKKSFRKQARIWPGNLQKLFFLFLYYTCIGKVRSKKSLALGYPYLGFNLDNGKDILMVLNVLSGNKKEF